MLQPCLLHRVSLRSHITGPQNMPLVSSGRGDHFLPNTAACVECGVGAARLFARFVRLIPLQVMLPAVVVLLVVVEVLVVLVAMVVGGADWSMMCCPIRELHRSQAMVSK